VAVFYGKQVPKQADVCVGCNIYRLYFKPDEVVQHVAPDPDEDGLQGEGNKDNDLDGDRRMEDAEAPNPLEPKNNTSDNSKAPHQNMPPQKQAALIEEGLDLPCEQLFNEISIKVMLEPDDGVTKEIYSPLTEEELAAYNALVDSPNKIHPSSVFGVPTSEILDGVASADANDLQCCAEDDTVEGQDGMGGSTLPIITPPPYWTPSRWDRVTVGLPCPRPLH
jgi:hypothetical protein